MVYNPATDFLGLWRNSGGSVSKMEIPGLDYVAAALARAGLITLSVSATAPVANQSTTAWLQAAVPSWSAEGALYLWNGVTSTYEAATPALFLQLLEATAGENGVSWWTSAGGPPLNTVGNNGDFAVRTDEPHGIYGPKTAGAWPADPIPGTANVITSGALDNTFGASQGQLIRRGAVEWEALPIGGVGELLASSGADPEWTVLTALMDVLFSNDQGSILYRAAGGWAALPPGVAAQVLATGGPGANPAWVPRSAEFDSGTVMVFAQTNAPVGWTKQTAINDYGLRVVSGAVGTTAGSAFSTVFAQATVGDHALTIAEMPSHTHVAERYNGQVPHDGGTPLVSSGAVGTVATATGATGGSAVHSHTVNLTLAYTDVIIAAKD